MKNFFKSIDQWFFADVSATGFGVMRILWALVVLIFMLGAYPDVARYWSNDGIIPPDLYGEVFRNEYRYTLLDTITKPEAVYMLYWTLIVSTFCMLIGLWPRLTTIISVLLLFSFHERNLQPLGGGDTVLRNIGFILMICPELRALSVDRLEQQWKHWKDTRQLLPPLRTQIWPYRLLLWQFMVIYMMSLYDKWQGTMWHDGTTVEAVFHHTHFARWPRWFMDAISPLSPFATAGFLIYEASWALLLIPSSLLPKLPSFLQGWSLKRTILFFGVSFHGGIALLLDVGSFSFVMMTGYTGLLLDEDWHAYKKLCNRWFSGKITVLYDGICYLCRRSMFSFQLLDILGRLQPVDFRDAAAKKKHAPKITEQDLDRAMHIKTANGTTYKGFDAFRKLAHHLPILWPLVPILYIPGVPPIGRYVYQKIADNRIKCAHGACIHASGK